MNIYVFSDESGVFDYVHNDIFVFAGLIILGSDNKTIWERKYAAAETAIKTKYPKGMELKAVKVSNEHKSKLFRSLNQCLKFSVIINQNKINRNIYKSKKDKQRYLDYAYKIAAKRAFEKLISEGVINPDEVDNLYFFVDEHTTATNGRYELREGLESEFKRGTYNYDWNVYYPPLFPEVKSVEVEFCHSESKRLIRCADIVANKVYYLAINGKHEEIKAISNLHNIYLP